MTQIPFDQLAKQYLEEVLTPLGQVERSFEVPGESKFVDVWFTPDPNAAAISDLGLLSRIVTTACLLEPFHSPPSRSEVRSCLLKLFWIQEDQRRRTQLSGRTLSEIDLPKLWILATSVSKPLLADFAAIIKAEWQPGIYFLPEAFKTAIVSIDELPATRETLGLRILGRGTTLQQAIAEVRNLAPTDPQRNQILRILTNWKVTIELSEGLEPDDRESFMALSQVYLEWERATEQRGMQVGKASLVLTQLNSRLGAIAPAAIEEIQSLSNEQLDRLAVALLGFVTSADLEQWLASRQS